MHLRGNVLGAQSLTGEQIRAGRALARLSQAELAKRSSLSLETIKRLEGIRGPVDANFRTMAALTSAFEAVGILCGTNGTDVVVKSIRGGRPPASDEPKAKAGAIHRVIYYSTSTMKSEALDENFLAAAESRNSAMGVTGVLMFCDGRFLQVVEGNRRDVLQIYGSISVDTRHKSLQVLQSTDVGARLFPDWRVVSDPARLARLAVTEPALAEGFRPEMLSPSSALGLLTAVREL